MHEQKRADFQDETAVGNGKRIWGLRIVLLRLLLREYAWNGRKSKNRRKEREK